MTRVVGCCNKDSGVDSGGLVFDAVDTADTVCSVAFRCSGGAGGDILPRRPARGVSASGLFWAALPEVTALVSCSARRNFPCISVCLRNPISRWHRP